MQSPLLNIANSWRSAIAGARSEIRGRVEAIQDKVHEGRGGRKRCWPAHFDVAAAMQSGAGDEQLRRRAAADPQAQLRWDYVAANNGMGFHSPQECMRILAAALDLAGNCRIECARILARTACRPAGRVSGLGDERKGPGLAQGDSRRQDAGVAQVRGCPQAALVA